MSGDLRNVDICVTCICDHPPQLPLREELPSLGIEVIYNAKGVGAEATEKEFKKEKNRIHQQRLKNMKKKGKKNENDKSTRSKRSMLSPPGKIPFSLKLGRANVEKKDPPEDLAIPKALSYGSYQQTLDIKAKNDTESISSSIETSASMDEKLNRRVRKKKLARRLKGLLRKKRNPNDPPHSVEFPNMQTLEDAALQEAFNAFMSDDDVNVPAKPAKISYKTGSKNRLFPDLLAGSKDNPEQLEKDEQKSEENQTKGVSDTSSSGVDQTTVSSLDNESAIFKTALIDDAEAFSKLALERLNKLAIDRGPKEAIAKEGINGRGNIKVKLLSNGTDNHITEIYDLTEISESGNDKPRTSDFPDILPDDIHDDQNDVVYHGSLAPTSPYAINYSDQYSEESSIPVPGMRDEFGRYVLDVSDVYEENGPGSPLVLSPVPQRDISSFDLSPASFAIPEYGQAKKKKSPLFPSFFSNPMRDDEFVPDGRDDIVVYRADDTSSYASFRERNLSPVKLDIASPYRGTGFNSNHSSHSANMRLQNFDHAVEDYKNARIKMSFQPSPASRRVPAIRKTMSRDSYDSFKMPKVSFSEDIEERRYFHKEKYDYEKSMAGVKSSLSAIVNEGRELTEPLPSALSREADAAFEEFTEQLEVTKNPRTPQQILIEALSYGDPLPFDFEETIKLHPSIASQKFPDVDTYALHLACLRAFSKRFAKDQTCRVKDLIHDLKLYRKLIEILIAADPVTCRRVDKNGDLPVHIMARQLMEWEGQWYQKVYDKSKSHGEDKDSGSGITTLYQSMSECINVLLQAVLEDDSLYLQSGSIGRILPLHIAAIFTVPYSTLKSLLEAFPNTASIKCELNDLKTFVPNHSTPLELHDRLSTDFPKWEIQRVNFSLDKEMTQDMLDKIYETTNGIRRSDLMFAYFPKLLPYRKDAHRIQRMEEMIKKEMQEQGRSDNLMLTRTTEAFWVWLCEFQAEDDVSDHYAESVSRIIGSLPFHSVRFLASVLNKGGHPVVDRATPSCADVIMERLLKITQTQIPVRVQRLSTSSNVISSKLNRFDEETSNRFRFHGKGFVGPLCRTIFNITETNYPVSFVILPYKLVKDGEGRLGLESSEAAQAAMKFAEFLSDLTTPKYVIDTLDHKACQTLGESLVDEINRASRESRRKHFTEFLKLYEKGPAYFYFIDDCTGIPIVDESDGIYPLLISDAAETVEKVFSMMLSGMILMRGEKAISILVDVLLDGNINLVLPNWIEAAKDLIGFTAAPYDVSTSPRIEGLLPLREHLIKLVQFGPTKNEEVEKFHRSGMSNEWVVEISLIKMIIEIRDPRHYFCGLSQQLAAKQVLWTHESDIFDEIHQIDFESPESLKAILGESPAQKSFADKDMSNSIGYERQSEGIGANGNNTDSSEYSSGEYTDETSEDEMPGMGITTGRRNAAETANVEGSDHAAGSLSYSQEKPEDDSSVDDSFDLDGVVKLRVELDEQEAKLHDLRDKVSYLGSEGDELEQREETIGSMIDEITSQKGLLETPSRDGLQKAKALLLRICELEDRVLCREIEVGQLKNDVADFQREASDRTESRGADDSRSSSGRRSAAAAQEMPKPSSRDEDINSVEADSGHVVNLNRILGIHDEGSSVGNSTMYDSSIDGYSAGFSTGMLRH